MMFVESLTIPRWCVFSIDAAILAMGFVGAGQADGPYPGMYEHWSSEHRYESPGLPGEPEQIDFVEEHTL